MTAACTMGAACLCPHFASRHHCTSHRTMPPAAPVPVSPLSISSRANFVVQRWNGLGNRGCRPGVECRQYASPIRAPVPATTACSPLHTSAVPRPVHAALHALSPSHHATSIALTSCHSSLSTPTPLVACEDAAQNENSRRGATRRRLARTAVGSPHPTGTTISRALSPTCCATQRAPYNSHASPILFFPSSIFRNGKSFSRRGHTIVYMRMRAPSSPRSDVR
ncbi:hypothetical protein BC834DRAFT_577452 [Gloeopeniophorella convolvens]|nr:hypothetical protein BC834DRAFT_577452 [Gloeopeniophorella convolvens]